MSRTILAKLGARLDERASPLAVLDAYAAGTQPLTYLSPESRTALAGRIQQVSVNVPRLVVSTLVERLRVTGFLRDGRPDPGLWATWTRGDLDQLAPVAHRESLTLGSSYVVVWAGRDGRAQVSVESPKQVIVERDPATRAVLSALKRWEAPVVPGSAAPVQRAVTFEPDVITRYSTDAAGAPATSGAWRVVETIRNPLGVVPVVPLVNAERLLDVDGTSEFADVIPLTDALVKLLSDLLVTSEFYARPRRWVTGIEVDEREVLDAEGQPTGETVAVDPFATEVNRTWIGEPPDAKFGQFTATDLAAYENGVKVIMQSIVAVTSLPEHVLGVGSDNPTSADAIRASEAGLTARAEAKQRSFGRAWEAVARLAVAVESGVDPASVDVSAQWADPTTRSVAQEADAAVKLVAAGVLPPSEALHRLGYTDDDITRIREARRLDGATITEGEAS